MKEEYAVSILVPVYGVEKYIDKCAESAFGQTFGDIQFIFVDDCGSDRSIERLKAAVERHPERKDDVLIVRHPGNKGLSAARNTAVRAARGRYIMHLDSDDWLSPDCVERMYERAESAGADVVLADTLEVYEDGGTFQRNYFFSTRKNEYLHAMLCRETNHQMAGKLIRRELVERHSLYSLEGISMGEDYVLYPRIAYYAGRVEKLDFTSYYYRQQGESMMHTASVKSLEQLAEGEDFITDFFRSHPEHLRPDTLALSQICTKKQMYAISGTGLYPFIDRYAADVEWRGLRLPLSLKLMMRFSEHGWHALIWRMFQAKRMYNRMRK